MLGKKRSSRKGPIEMLVDAHRSAIRTVDARAAHKLIHNSGKTTISVIRTKGGSGESHAVKEIAEFYLAENNKVLVVAEKPIPRIWSDNTIVMDTAKKHATCDSNERVLSQVEMQWTDMSEKELAFLRGCGYDVLIFTIGSARTAGSSYDRITAATLLADVTFLTVDNRVRDSIDPAQKWCRSRRLKPAETRTTYVWSWGTSVVEGESQYSKTLIPLSKIASGDDIASFVNNRACQDLREILKRQATQILASSGDATERRGTNGCAG